MEKNTFYWLKLKNNFFDRDEIRIIESHSNGKDYIIFYLKMLLKSVSSNGNLMFRDTIPYSPEMLSTLTNTNVDTVIMAVEMFLKLGLMERFSDGKLFMVETQNMLGKETKWANYKRKERAELPLKNKEIGHCPIVSKNSPIEKEKEYILKNIYSFLSLDKFKEVFENEPIGEYFINSIKQNDDDNEKKFEVNISLKSDTSTIHHIVYLNTFKYLQWFFKKFYETEQIPKNTT